MIDNETGLAVFYICLAFGGVWLLLLGLAKVMSRGHPPLYWQGEQDDARVVDDWFHEYEIKREDEHERDQTGSLRAARGDQPGREPDPGRPA